MEIESVEGQATSRVVDYSTPLAESHNRVQNFGDFVSRVYSTEVVNQRESTTQSEYDD